MKHGTVIVADPVAKEEAIRWAAMPEALLVPVAAVSLEAIRSHVGRDCVDVSHTQSGGALRVVAECGPEPSDLAVWKHKRSSVISQRIQLWVDVEYSRYRAAYRTVFPEEDIVSVYVCHIMDRRYAKLHGFRYVRLVTNSLLTKSRNGFSESWGRNLALDDTLRRRTGEASVRYADLTHLMTILDMPIGGGVMENVRLAVDLLRPAQR